LELPRDAPLAGEVARDVNPCPSRPAARREIRRTHEHHAPAAMHAAIAVVQTEDGGVELVVAPDRHQEVVIPLESVVRYGCDGEVRLPR